MKNTPCIYDVELIEDEADTGMWEGWGLGFGAGKRPYPLKVSHFLEQGDSVIHSREESKYIKYTSWHQDPINFVLKDKINHHSLKRIFTQIFNFLYMKS